jgi:hypothetical protein
VRNFISTNRYLFWILSISLLLLALDVAADHFFSAEPRLDEVLDFSRPTHLDKDLSIRKATRYWVRVEFSKHGRSSNASGGAAGVDSVISYPVTIGLQKSGADQKVVDEKSEMSTYFFDLRPESSLLATPDLEFGRYHLQLDLPAVPQLASEKANLTLVPDPKGAPSPQMNAVIAGYAILALVVAPIDFIVLIFLGIRGVTTVLRWRSEA